MIPLGLICDMPTLICVDKHYNDDDDDDDDDDVMLGTCLMYLTELILPMSKCSVY